MLQVLLADYFLSLYHQPGEPRQLQRYTLSVAKDGPKLQDATPDEVAANTARVLAYRGPGELMKPVPGGVAFKSFRIETFTQYLSQMLDRPVVDETGLTGQYDFEFTFYTPNVGPAPVPSTPRAANAQSAIPQTNDNDQFRRDRRSQETWIEIGIWKRSGRSDRRHSYRKTCGELAAIDLCAAKPVRWHRRLVKRKHT